MDLNSSEEEPLTPTTYKKRYSSSWFYGQQDNSFPTIEEQVELCRKIASQLVNDENKESKGASMFYKRVKRAPKWVHQSTRITTINSGSTTSLNNFGDNDKSGGGMGGFGGDQGSMSEDEREQIEKMRQRFRDESRKPLKLILDPRELKSVERLRKSGTSFSEHNVISPDVCHNLVKDLNSPEINKGAQIFLKRKEKSTQWVVEENQASRDIREIKERQERQAIENAGSELSSRPESRLSNYNNQLPQQAKLLEQQTQQRVRLVKSPWEAALTTGSVDNAFETVTPSRVVQTVKEVAAVKKQSSFDNQPVTSFITDDPLVDQSSSSNLPLITTTTINNQIINNSSGIYNQKLNYNKDLYLARAPRGWNTDEPRRDGRIQQPRPMSTSSFYQQTYYQPGSGTYSPLTVEDSLPDSSRNASHLGMYDQSIINDQLPTMINNATTTDTSRNRITNYGTLYTSQSKSHLPSKTQYQQYNHQQNLKQPPSNIELPHFDLLTFASSQNSLPKYRNFNASPQGFSRQTGLI